ncbi:MAG: substrate-binding protein [Mesorhizobium sp.]
MTKSHSPNRRHFLQGSALAAGAAMFGSMPFINRGLAAGEPVRIGIALDQTGRASVFGIPGTNTARMVTEQINAAGGILGRPMELFIADTATDESTGVANVRTMLQRDRVDVVIGGLSSSMRKAIKSVIVDRNKTLYMYPTLYEGGECTPYLYSTGATPAQQCEMLIPWMIEQGAKRFAVPGSDYLWPQVMAKRVREAVESRGGEIVFEELYPFDQVDFSAAVNRIISAKADVVINNVVPPGAGPLVKQLHQSGFHAGGGRIGSFYYDENALNLNSTEEMEGVVSCLDWFQVLADKDPFSKSVLDDYTKMFPGKFTFTAGNSSVSVYRCMKLYAAAVEKAGSVDRDAVAAALETVQVEAPGGTSSFVPGKRHLAMNMYLAECRNGRFEIATQSNGPIIPQEC